MNGAGGNNRQKWQFNQKPDNQQVQFKHNQQSSGNEQPQEEQEKSAKELEKERAQEASEKVGQTAARAAADYYTGGKYEKIRNIPVVGTVAQKVENKAGKAFAKVDKMSGNKVGKVAEKFTSKETPDNSTPDNDNTEKAVNEEMNKAAAKAQNKEAKKKKKEEQEAKRKRTIIIIICLAVLILLFPVIMLIALLISSFSSSMAYGNYYPMPCEEVTVIFVDENYEPTKTETYPLEDYIAGVLVGEVDYLGSYEVDKAFALAARTYFVAFAQNYGCTIESSARYQVFKEEKSETATKAAYETKGRVLLKNNQLYDSIQYDAFACIAEDSNYYTIAQAEQKIPKTWVDSKLDRNNPRISHWFNCNGKENLQEHHGNGMSQYGSLYLAEELQYDYTQILKFYLGDDIAISSNSNLDVKSTADAKNVLRTPIDEFLKSNGSSLEEFNQYIKDSVDSSGYGTREGVVAAAVSMINFLYDNFDTKLPYYWGGGHQSVWEREYGILSSVGTYQQSPQKPSGAYDYYYSFDCSGFVSWVVRNGGYNFSTRTAARFITSLGSDTCLLTSSSCVGVAGDIIANTGHVQIIVGVNEDNGTYYIAESANGVTISEKSMHFSGGNYLIHMDSFYNNQSNVDANRVR